LIKKLNQINNTLQYLVFNFSFAKFSNMQKENNSYYFKAILHNNDFEINK